MTEQQAIQTLERAHENGTGFYTEYGIATHYELCPTRAGEYLIDEHECDEQLAYKYSYAWVARREGIEHADRLLGDEMYNSPRPAFTND